MLAALQFFTVGQAFIGMLRLVAGVPPVPLHEPGKRFICWNRDIGLLGRNHRRAGYQQQP